MNRNKTMHAQRNRRAVALVIVLAMLVLLSGLLVAFMSTATTERASAQFNAGSLAARQMSDSVVNLVIGQLREATSTLDDRTTWASQPGAIRTFSGRLTATRRSLPRGAYYYEYQPGDKDEVFKLYSSDQMRIAASDYVHTNSASDLGQEVDVIEKWDVLNPPFGYVDMNEPALLPRRSEDRDDFTVEPRYPIMDPRATLSRNETSPSTSTPSIVEGADARLVDDPNARTENGQPVRRLPMPVKWLWVLKDGSVGPISRASRQNPVIGRVAFWTDDETCKLNINTSSEGTFWDTPSVSCANESGQVTTNSPYSFQSSPNSYSLAASQPTRSEYQRYPGHPATTCLSPVLGWLWPGFNPYGSVKNMAPGYANFKDSIAALIPFLPNGPLTSRGGTHNPSESLPLSGEPKMPVMTKRLYATIDELAFKEPTDINFDGRIQSNPITPEALEKLRFFLTTSSRAPELNLFGRPRVTIWPVSRKIEDRTTFDDLFAFSSTIVGKEFYLSRTNARSATEDVDLNTRPYKLYEYLQAMTGDRMTDIPGFGGNFKNKFGSNNIPTANGGQAKIFERDQILTMMFDYMRTVNLVDTGTAAKNGNTFDPYTPFYGDDAYNASVHPREWSGQVTPTRIGNTQGLGRFPTVMEAALIISRAGPIVEDKQNQVQAVLALEMGTVMPGYPGIRETYWTRVINLRGASLSFSSATGVVASDPDIGLCSDGNSKGEWRINIPNVPAHEIANGRAFQMTLGYMTNMFWYTENKKPLYNPFLIPHPDQSTDRTPKAKLFEKHPSTFGGDFATSPSASSYQRGTTLRYYPYVSDFVPFPANVTQLNLVDGGKYRVEIYSGEAPDDTRSTLVQTLDISFPQAAINGFVMPVEKKSGNSTVDAAFGKRLVANSDTEEYFDVNLDIVRSVEAVGIESTGPDGKPAIPDSNVHAKGDLRLMAGRIYVDQTYFAHREANAQDRWFDTSRKIMHAMQSSWGDAQIEGYSDIGKGKLAKNGTIRNHKAPVLPKGVNGVSRLDPNTRNLSGPGDWTRGISKNMSGAFGGKVDEGNVRFGDVLNSSASGALPYYRGKGIEETGYGFFSPNKQISSAVAFGSLPTGVIRRLPWQTLLFRPDRELTAKGHPGAEPGEPPDHLLLDLFHMPVVEPYAISEPLSTGGKVNLNYVLAPFGYAKGASGNDPGTSQARSYIRRDTALRGVLKAVKIMAVPTSMSDGGHREAPLDDQSTVVRYDIDLNRTLEQFEMRLKNPTRGLFRSASEICDVDLFPQGQIPSDWRSYWDNQYAQTGDNKRETPYAHIYPRVTTQSNVFTVHMRCQAVKLKPGAYSDEGVDTEGIKESDVLVQGEYRGSSTIERFIDPNDPLLKVNYRDEVAERLEPYYRYRIVSSKQFLPQ